jgi:hypothetical protein
MCQRVTGSFRVVSMGGGAFNLLKMRQIDAESAKDAESHLPGLSKSLAVL